MCIKPVGQEEKRQTMRNNTRSFGSASQLSSLAEDKSVDFNNEPSPSSVGTEPEPMKRVPSSIFHGAGDSGVWPGQAPSHGAIGFITPITMAYIVVWYISGAFTNSSSKQTLQHFDKNFLSLTLMQHSTAAICGSFMIRVLKVRKYKPLPEELQNWGFYRLVLVYTCGFCLTNGAFGAVNASLVDTVKAGEPIATVILTLLFLPGEKVTIPIFLSLLPIVAGVGISSMSDASFQLLGLAMAMGSNLCFSARSICAKLLRSSLGKQMDNANLFVHVNFYGAMALLPVVLFAEGPVLVEQLVDGGPARKLLLLNGVVYWLNNQMNFLVLEKVDAVTHGLINCGRRIANIAFAIVWFGVTVTIYNGIGMSLALLGTFSYMRVKQRMSGPSKPAAKSFSPMPTKRAL